MFAYFLVTNRDRNRNRNHMTQHFAVSFFSVVNWNFRRTLIKDVEIEFLATTKNEPSKNERLNKNAK